MNIKEVFNLCKNTFGSDVRYVRQIDDKTFEAHEVKQRRIVKYVFEVIDKKIKILIETEETL